VLATPALIAALCAWSVILPSPLLVCYLPPLPGPSLGRARWPRD
jgi:hypothetical protein